MKRDINPLQQADHSDGMTVPEGYFADFAARMARELPEREPAPKVMPRTLWQRVRPYAYLAAMFAGIWCMLQMFSMMGGVKAPGDEWSVSDNPVLAEALGSDSFIYEDYGMDIDDYDLYDELFDAGVDPATIL